VTLHTTFSQRSNSHSSLGCALVISHDRWFLDRICTHIIAFEGNSNVVFFDGNYSAYEKDRKDRLGSKFDPSRIKFRRLEKV
jgi:ATPase subunit of ABC transporter with duplicated ATPase domains